MKKLILLATVLFTLISCKKIIEVSTQSAPPKIVIEGEINDTNQNQTIFISKTIGYDNLGSYPAISGADVTVYDDKGDTYIFSETAPGKYISKIQGVSGRTYNLNVYFDGQIYKATSTMPRPVPIDSIGVITNNFFNKERINPIIYFTDPKDETNYYHFNLFINGKISKRTYVQNDRLTNGKVNQLQFFYNDDDNAQLKSGDKVSVEMECTDKAVYNYWYVLAQQAGNGPNSGATPANPTSNISNGALGYFSANTYQDVTVTIR